MTRVSESFFRGRLGITLGLLLFFIGILRYRSYENQAVLGRWSYPFSVLIIITGLLLIVGIARSWKARQRQVSHSVKLGSVLVDFAILLWGSAYLLGAIDSSENGGRIADLDLFGSVMPAAASLEWLALVLLALATVHSMWKNRNYEWSKLGLAIWPIVLFILMAEGVVRLLSMVAPTVQGFPTNSSMLWARKYIQLNREGFRDQEHTLEREANTRRLLVVGDSYAHGWGIKRVKDRFGEQLAKKLKERTGENWEIITASKPDTHTLDHIKLLRSMQGYQPDLVILLYVFGDIYYLTFVTSREGQSEAPKSVLDRIDPIRILYKNSYLFQEAYVRIRLISYNLRSNNERNSAPYKDRVMLTNHLSDVSRFVSIAAQSGAIVAVVPFDVEITANGDKAHLYTYFVNTALSLGIPIWPVERAFMGYDFDQLTVNKLDRHPNELANHLLAEVVAVQALKDLDGRVEKRPSDIVKKAATLD